MSTLASLAACVADCRECPLGETRTKTVFGRGSPEARVMFVGEGPGLWEDQDGRPFAGPSGKLLDRMVRAMGLDPEIDIYVANVVKCRPPANRNPLPNEITACLGYLKAQVRLVSPEIIVLLGKVATDTLLAAKGESFARLRGKTTLLWLDLESRPWHALPTYHPAYLLREPAMKAIVWRDLQHVMSHLERTVSHGRSRDLPAGPA